MDNGREHGKVKWFNAARGFGFLVSPSREREIFVHYSNIQQEGYKTLDPEEEVEFTFAEGPKGPHALEVRRLSKP